MRVAIMPTVVGLQFDQLAARNIGAECAERWKAKARSGVIENVQNGVPQRPG
jgi:hypothetical protein